MVRMVVAMSRGINGLMTLIILKSTLSVEKLTKILNTTFHLRSQLDACNEYESSQSELYPISGSGSEINDKLIKFVDGISNMNRYCWKMGSDHGERLVIKDVC